MAVEVAFVNTYFGRRYRFQRKIDSSRKAMFQCDLWRFFPIRYLLKTSSSRFTIASFLFIKSLMTKEKMIETIQRVLGTDVDLSFLLLLKTQEIETLLACIRAGMGK